MIKTLWRQHRPQDCPSIPDSLGGTSTQCSSPRALARTHSPRDHASDHRPRDLHSGVAIALGRVDGQPVHPEKALQNVIADAVAHAMRSQAKRVAGNLPSFPDSEDESLSSDEIEEVPKKAEESIMVADSEDDEVAKCVEATVKLKPVPEAVRPGERTPRPNWCADVCAAAANRVTAAAKSNHGNRRIRGKQPVKQSSAKVGKEVKGGETAVSSAVHADAKAN